MPCTVGHGEAGCACIQRGSSAISHLLVCSQSRELMVADPVARRVCALQLPGASGTEGCAALPPSPCSPGQAGGDAQLALPALGARGWELQDDFCLGGGSL